MTHTSKFLIFYALIALHLGACTSSPATPQPTGILQGHVSIGPLVPVLREGETEPTPSPEMYAAYPITVYSADGNNEIATLVIDSQGNYQIELAAGDYLINSEQRGPSFAAGLPIIIKLFAGETTFLDIEIDTGIR